MNPIDGTKEMFAQLSKLLKSIPPDQYSLPLDVFNNSTLGNHFRHIIEFYSCLIEGNKTGIINYSSRKRDILLETLPSEAALVLAKNERVISNLNRAKKVKVRADFGTEIQSQTSLVESSIGRELSYCFDHSIHHLAIIRIGMEQNFQEINIPPCVGIAPSTIRNNLKSQRTQSLLEWHFFNLILLALMPMS